MRSTPGFTSTASHMVLRIRSSRCAISRSYVRRPAAHRARNPAFQPAQPQQDRRQADEYGGVEPKEDNANDRPEKERERREERLGPRETAMTATTGVARTEIAKVTNTRTSRIEIDNVNGYAQGSGPGARRQAARCRPARPALGPPRRVAPPSGVEHDPDQQRRQQDQGGDFGAASSGLAESVRGERSKQGEQYEAGVDRTKRTQNRTEEARAGRTLTHSARCVSAMARSAMEIAAASQSEGFGGFPSRLASYGLRAVGLA